MVSEWVVEERPLRNWWVVLRCDFHKDGVVDTYVSDILDDEVSALLSAEGSRRRHLLWDHCEALKMNN